MVYLLTARACHSSARFEGNRDYFSDRARHIHSTRLRGATAVRYGESLRRTTGTMVRAGSPITSVTRWLVGWVSPVFVGVPFRTRSYSRSRPDSTPRCHRRHPAAQARAQFGRPSAGRPSSPHPGLFADKVLDGLGQGGDRDLASQRRRLAEPRKIDSRYHTVPGPVRLRLHCIQAAPDPRLAILRARHKDADGARLCR
jgi:hypothetical protein